MIGAICGDIAGSYYEWTRTKKKDEVIIFHPESDFTDDTVLTVAVADAILNRLPYRDTVISYAKNYPGRGYGARFSEFLHSEDPQPYNSFGNGSAMRVSPVGWAFESEEEVLEQAEASAVISHNHPEGIKGAQSVAMAVFWARKGKSKDEIRQLIGEYFGYDLSRSLDDIRSEAVFDETCQVSVPEAIIAFLGSTDCEDAIRNAISLGADADTQAAIAGAIGEAYYGEISPSLSSETVSFLPKEFQAVISNFYGTFIKPNSWH